MTVAAKYIKSSGVLSGVFTPSPYGHPTVVENVITDPSDSLSLLSVLSGELFEFSDETFAQLKLKHGSLRKGVHEEYPEAEAWFNELRANLHEGMPALLDRVAAGGRAADLTELV